VDTYVYYLRGKLGSGVVRTVRGVGYRLGDL
jgi:two-component system response regulator QseB